MEKAFDLLFLGEEKIPTMGKKKYLIYEYDKNHTKIPSEDSSLLTDKQFSNEHQNSPDSETEDDIWDNEDIDTSNNSILENTDLSKAPSEP